MTKGYIPIHHIDGGIITNGSRKKYEDLTEEDLDEICRRSHPGLECTENDIVKWITENEDIRILRALMIETKKHT